MGSGEGRYALGHSKKGYISAGPGVYQNLLVCITLATLRHYGTYIHTTSSGEGVALSPERRKLENLYQKTLYRGVLRGYQGNLLAERRSRSKDCLKNDQ